MTLLRFRVLRRDWQEHRLLCGFYDEYMENTPFGKLPDRPSFSQFLHPDLLRQFMDLEKAGLHPPENFALPEGEQQLPFRFHSLRANTSSSSYQYLTG